MANNYTDTAVSTTLSATIASGATSLVVASATGYPAVPFFIAVDPNTTGVEVMLVTAVSGTTFTVTRGQSTTTASAHNAGATVQHVVPASFFNSSGGGAGPGTYAEYFPSGFVGNTTPAITVLDRRLANSAVQSLSTQRVVVQGFIAPVSMSISNVSFYVTTTNTSANVTVGQFGIYSVNNSNNGTLLASSTNNTSLFAATGRTVQALSSSASLVAGQAYAFATLAVFSTGAIQVVGTTPPGSGSGQFSLTSTGSLVPFGLGVITGLSSMPASFTAPLTITGANPLVYAELF